MLIATQQHWHTQQQERHVASLALDDDEAGVGLWSDPTPSQSLSSLQGLAQAGYKNKGLGIAQTGRGTIHTGMSMQQQGGVHVRRTGGGIQDGEHTGFLRMRGLPFSSTKAEIFAFFVGHNPIEDSIVLTYRNDGRATGEGYVQFESPEDAKNAMALHKKLMGSRYIELFISNKDEHSRAFARFSDRE